MINLLFRLVLMYIHRRYSCCLFIFKIFLFLSVTAAFQAQICLFFNIHRYFRQLCFVHKYLMYIILRHQSHLVKSYKLLKEERYGVRPFCLLLYIKVGGRKRLKFQISFIFTYVKEELFQFPKCAHFLKNVELIKSYERKRTPRYFANPTFFLYKTYGDISGKFRTKTVVVSQDLVQLI